MHEDCIVDVVESSEKERLRMSNLHNLERVQFCHFLVHVQLPLNVSCMNCKHVIIIRSVILKSCVLKIQSSDRERLRFQVLIIENRIFLCEMLISMR